MRFRRAWLFVLLALAAVATAQYRDRQTWAERDQWSRAAEVMDALGVYPGSKVADVGAGEGYFTVKFAERVGPKGKVYAEDIDSATVANLRKMARERGLKQVEAIEGLANDPRLPGATARGFGALDAVLVVNAYHEFGGNRDAMLTAIRHSLRPHGVLGIIDKDADRDPNQPRETYETRHQLPRSFVLEDLKRAGFTVIAEKFDLKPTGNRAGERWYFITASTGCNDAGFCP